MINTDEIIVGNKVLATVQIDYSMEDMVGTIVAICDPISLDGEYYILDCGEYSHSIFRRNIIKKIE